ncbi:hypothetical protein ACFQO4_20800 [Saliphagus sp. GCM10025334]
MSDYPNRTRKELYGYAVSKGIDVSSSMTKGSLESAIRAELGGPEETDLEDGVDFDTRVDHLLLKVREADGELCIRFESNPNPMYATLEDDGAFQLWAFDYSKKCQTKTDHEDFLRGFETAEAAIRSCAYDTYHVTTTSPEEIDTDAKPTATSLGDYA